MFAVGFGSVVNVAMVWISLVSTGIIRKTTNTHSRDIMDGIDIFGTSLQTY